MVVKVLIVPPIAHVGRDYKGDEHIVPSYMGHGDTGCLLYRLWLCRPHLPFINVHVCVHVHAHACADGLVAGWGMGAIL